MKFTFAPESRPLEGYTIKRAIYRGGFGEVYYALTDAGREVALKLLQNNSEVELRGVQQCLNLSHPNLVTIFDVRQDGDGDHWIIMEYIAGDTLDVAIRRHPNGMPMEDVRRWLPGLAAGVSFLHDRGIVHRDLKPGNIFSENRIVKVGDVGLSKFITPSRRSAQTQSVGTVYYMAPEVAKGSYGKEVDIYALGIILYEMLTGQVPFDGESTGEILMKHLSASPDLSLLPPRVRPVIGKALQKDPARRQRSVAELADAFEQAVLGRKQVIDIPDEAFAADRIHTAAEVEERVQPVQNARGATPHSSQAANNQWWWWIVAAAVLVFLAGGSVIPVVQIGVLATLAYAVYAGIRWVTNPANAAASGGAAVAAAHRPATPQRDPLRGAVRRQSSPASPRDLNLVDRVADFSGSAALATVLIGLMVAGIGIVAPDFFANAVGLGRLDEGAIGLFAGTAVLAVWAVAAASKLMEGRRMESGTRRLVLLIAGCAVGAGAWGLDQALMVDFNSQPTALFASIGSRPLLESSEPTLLGYVVFFGLLFALRRWWWHADAYRASRLRVSSLLITVMVAWLLSAVWAFPQVWAVVWAAVISSVVQLASVWTPPEARRLDG